MRHSLHVLCLPVLVGALGTAGAVNAQPSGGCPTADPSVRTITNIDPGPDRSSIALAVNNAGVVVGYRNTDADPTARAFAWSRDARR